MDSIQKTWWNKVLGILWIIGTSWMCVRWAIHPSYRGHYYDSIFVNISGRIGVALWVATNIFLWLTVFYGDAWREGIVKWYTKKK